MESTRSGRDPYVPAADWWTVPSQRTSAGRLTQEQQGLTRSRAYIVNSRGSLSTCTWAEPEPIRSR